MLPFPPFIGRRPFQVSDIFANGIYAGFDFTDLSRFDLMWQSSAGTTPITASGQQVGKISSKPPPTASGTQGTSAARPTYTESGALRWLNHDGSDDHLLTSLVPSAAQEMTLAACFRATGNDVIMGAAGGGSCFIQVATSGLAQVGWRNINNNAVGSGYNDAGSTDVVYLMRGNSTFVEFWRNGVLLFSSAASTGLTSNPIMIGAFNSSGTPIVFLTGRIYRTLAVQRYIPDAYVIPLMRALGAGVVSF